MKKNIILTLTFFILFMAFPLAPVQAAPTPGPEAVKEKDQKESRPSDSKDESDTYNKDESDRHSKDELNTHSGHDQYDTLRNRKGKDQYNSGQNRAGQSEADSLGFASDQSLVSNYNQHGQEFGDITAEEEYLQRAQDFCKRAAAFGENIVIKSQSNGKQIFFYDMSTGEFLSILRSKNDFTKRYINKYSKPSNGFEHWNKLSGKIVSNKERAKREQADKKAEINPNSLNFRSDDRRDSLEEHYKKHGQEFHTNSKEQYLQKAQDFYKEAVNEGIDKEEVFTESCPKKRSTLYYRPSTGGFLVISDEGFIRSYYKISSAKILKSKFEDLETLAKIFESMELLKTAN